MRQRELNRRSALLTVSALVVVGACVVAFVRETPTAFVKESNRTSSSVGSASATAHAMAAANQPPAVSDVAEGALVTIGTSGAQIQLSATGACLVANDSLLKDATSVIPTGCVTADSSTVAASSNGLDSQLISWNTTTVVYGVVPAASVRVSLVDAGALKDAAILQPRGASWRVFYFVLPFKPYDVTDAGSQRTHFAITAFDAFGKTLVAAP